MAEPTMNKQDNIRIIEDSVDGVRQTPDVYIGALGSTGFKNMAREILQNSLDEIVKGNTIDKNIIMSYDSRNHGVIVEDVGQGIPIDILPKVFSVLHSSSNYDKKDGSGKYSSGKNGMGATITNYLSRIFTVESRRMDGSAAMVEYKEGRLVKNEPLPPIPGVHGLKTMFAPSDMMGHIDVSTQELEQMIWELCLLFPIDTKIHFNAIEPDGTKRSSLIWNKRGIMEILEKICQKPVIKPIYFSTDNGTRAFEALFTYDVENMDDPVIVSFANMCRTTNDSVHVLGFLDSLTKYFRDYMNKIYLANSKKKLLVNLQDIRTGLRAVITCKSLHPYFEGQAKTRYTEQDMAPFATETAFAGIDEWVKKNPSELNRLCNYFKDVCIMRSSLDKEKIKMQDKYSASVVTGYPAKYKKPNGKGPFSVFIVEGDSAAASLENNRDKATMGVFPVRGKVPNCFTHSTKDFFENEEIAGMFKIFGYDRYYKNFDPEAFRPEKVIIASDSDDDGFHIQCLVMMMFLRYLPFVLEQGKLYVATPPLYGIPIGKNKMKFLTDKVDYVDYIQSLFCKNNTIGYSNTGRGMTRLEVEQLLYNNIDYLKILTHISNIFAIEPNFLEFLVYNRDLPFDKFKVLIQKAQRYVKVTNENGTVMIRGLVGTTYQTIFFNQQLLNECRPIIELIERDQPYYLLNGNKVTIGQIMQAFASYEPKEGEITRYKGLGEMPPEQLAISTILPGQRTLKQYTTTDVKRELEFIRNIQSDKIQFIKGIKIRREDVV